MTIKHTLHIGLIALAMLATAFVFIHTAKAVQTYSAPTLSNTYVDHTFLNATTTSATSTESRIVGDRTMRIDGAKSVVLYFSRGDTRGTGNTGNTQFSVQVSRDGSEWFNYNTLKLNTATTTDFYPALVSSVTITAATSTVIGYMENLGFHFLRCVALETTDGEHTCRASATF